MTSIRVVRSPMGGLISDTTDRLNNTLRACSDRLARNVVSRQLSGLIMAMGVCLCSLGCGGGSDETPTVASPKIELGSAGSSGDVADNGMSSDEPPADFFTSAEQMEPEAAQPQRGRTYQPVTLGDNTAVVQVSANEPGTQNKDEGFDNVVDALHPLQVVLGEWRGITQKAIGGFSAVDTVNWVWDFQSDKEHPALVMTSPASPYFTQARLTYLSAEKTFQLTTIHKDGVRRVYTGQFSRPPEDVVGDNNKPQRTYKLQLQEVSARPDREMWQVAFNQQENNRYLLELYRKRPNGEFVRFDTVSNQREGTSFALSDSDYKEKTCIISQGLGTMQVTDPKSGASYWVCCSGCKAAFEEDPARWVARRAEQE